MFFRVENLGPLREAEVDLSKEMILLTGPNGTGKTYVAWSVYGLFRSPSAPKVFHELAGEMLASPQQAIPIERIAALWPRILAEAADQLASRLHLCFAAERQYFADVRVVLRAGANEPSWGMVSPIGYAYSGEYQVRIYIQGRALVAYAFHRDSPKSVPFTQIPSALMDVLADGIGDELGTIVMKTCWPYCAILPTERVDVDMFAKELSTRRMELVDRIVEAKIDAQPEPMSLTRDVGRYPWPIQDSLRMANDLVRLAKGKGEFADLAVELETLLGGAVYLSKEGEVGFKPEGAPATLGIHLSSSIVKSLVRLVFFLRHIARKGDLLMIDEPELNLHPDNQRKVARVLAKAVNRGLRMIMSTHSDYILRELNNLVLLSRDTQPIKDLRAELGYADAELLSPSKLGVYLFQGGTAENVPVTEEGFEARTIEEEINKLNAVSQQIYVALNG